MTLRSETINPEDLSFDDLGVFENHTGDCGTAEENQETFEMPNVFRFGTNLPANLMSVHAALVHYNRDFGETVFFRNGELVYIKKDESGRPFIKSMRRADLNYILKKAGTWKKYNGDAEINLPKDFLDTVLAGASPEDFENIPALKGIREGAYLTRDGIVSAAGFNKQTGIYLTRGYEVRPVPEHPAKDDLIEAQASLRNLFKEFRFDSQTDYENTVLGVSTLVTLPMLSEPVPILVVDKNTSGAGATFLSTIMGICALGNAPRVRPSTTRSGEMDKEVRSAVMQGDTFVVFDNVKAGTEWAPEVMLSISSGTGEINMRLIGTGSTVSCAPKMMFAVNGININARADVVRRMFRVRLTTKYALIDEKPFSMSKSDLMKLAFTLHPEIVRAVAVIRNAWIDAGCPPAPSCGGNMSEYPEWYRECVSPLYFAGFHELLQNEKDVQSDENGAESEGADLITALCGIYPGAEFTPKGLLGVLMKDAEMRHSGTFEGILNFCPDEIVDAAMNRKLTAAKVGRWVASITNTKYAGCPKYIKKLGRSPEGYKYVLADVEQQVTL